MNMKRAAAELLMKKVKPAAPVEPKAEPKAEAVEPVEDNRIDKPLPAPEGNDLKQKLKAVEDAEAAKAMAEAVGPPRDPRNRTGKRADYKGPRTTKTFRLRVTTVQKLSWLSDLTGESQTDILESILDAALNDRIEQAEQEMGPGAVDAVRKTRRAHKIG